MEISGKRALVTGGLGFIGSHIVESLLGGGAAQVRVLDNYRTGTEANIAAVRDSVEVIRGDILDPAALDRAVRGVDLVSHQAAQLEITRAIEDPVEDLTTNTVGTLNVFAACARAGVRRIVQASSAGVYGQAVRTPQAEDDHPTEPNWAYGVSKLANEKYAAIMREVHGLEITSLRYGIVYGPREWYGRVLTIFLRRALDGQPLIVFGDGEQVRDFVFVDDVVSMHRRCIADPAALHQVFNVATGQGVTVNRLAELVLQVTGRRVPIIHEDLPEGAVSSHFARRRLPQELRTLVQSPEKARRLLGWEAETGLERGLAAEWGWLGENPQRWTEMSY
jgi:UDP-glucose 4-epimerase